MRRRRHRFRLLDWFYLVILTGLLVGGSVWLDKRGEIVTGTVSARNEEVVIRVDPEGTWYRWYRVGVLFPATAAIGSAATIGVSRERYDQLTVGDSIQVRYLSFLPLLARAANRSTLTVAGDAGSRLLFHNFLGTLLLWLCAGFLALWIASRIGGAAILVVGVAWIGAAWPMLFPPPAPVVLPSTDAMARVERISDVTKSPERRGSRRRRSFRFRSDEIRRLDQPYQVVQFRFTVPGQTDSVLAVDAVDSASVRDLAVGATLPVRYDPRSPRDARLAIGSRTFLERNRYHFLIPALGVSVLGTLAAWGWLWRRTSRG